MGKRNSIQTMVATGLTMAFVAPAAMANDYAALWSKDEIQGHQAKRNAIAEQPKAPETLDETEASALVRLAAKNGGTINCTQGDAKGWVFDPSVKTVLLGEFLKFKNIKGTDCHITYDGGKGMHKAVVAPPPKRTGF